MSGPTIRDSLEAYTNKIAEFRQRDADRIAELEAENARLRDDLREAWQLHELNTAECVTLRTALTEARDAMRRVLGKFVHDWQVRSRMRPGVGLDPRSILSSAAAAADAALSSYAKATEDKNPEADK